MAKRLRQFLEDVFPIIVTILYKALTNIKTIKGDFEEKTEVLDELTKRFVNKKNTNGINSEK